MDTTISESNDAGVLQEDPKNRMEKYRISDEEWNKIQNRLCSKKETDKLESERFDNRSSSERQKCKSASERNNSKLAKYRISGELWDQLDKRLKNHVIDPGLPPKPNKSSQKDYTKQISEDIGYAKLDHMKSRRPSQENPEYEKMKKSPHPQRKQESSLQQKIQQRKELSQSIQSLDALQDLKPLTIPKDGDLQSFSVDDMSTFFRYMCIDDSIVQRLSRKNLDGIRFSKLKDSDLENIGIKNPIILHFRDRSSCKKRIPFML